MSDLLNRASYHAGPYAPSRTSAPTSPCRSRASAAGALGGLRPELPQRPLRRPPPWFDGDGMVHAVHVEDGRATYRNRWCRRASCRATSRPAARAAPASSCPSTRATPSPSPTRPTPTSSGTTGASTPCGLGGQPYGVDPVSLETRGAETSAVGSTAAWPPTPRSTPPQARCASSTSPSGRRPTCSTGRRPREQVRPPAGRGHPQPTFMHDIAVTPNFTVFLDLPMTWDQGSLAKGRRRISFLKECPARFGVVGHRGAEVQWFETDPCYCYHTINAWEETDEDGHTVVVLTACRIEDPIPTTRHEAEPTIPRLTFLRLEPFFWEWRFNLGTGAVRSRQLDDVAGEFPRMNDRFLGRPHRYSFMPASPLAHPAVRRAPPLRPADRDPPGLRPRRRLGRRRGRLRPPGGRHGGGRRLAGVLRPLRRRRGVPHAGRGRPDHGARLRPPPATAGPLRLSRGVGPGGAAPGPPPPADPSPPPPS